MAWVTIVSEKLKGLLGSVIYLSGGFLLLRRLHRHWYGPGIRIVFYHRASSKLEDFRKHLLHLRRWYRVMTLDDAAEALRSGARLPEYAVVVTFDDGYRDNFTVALPLLEKYRLPATLFVVTSGLDGEPLWFDEVRRWFMETRVPRFRLIERDKEFPLTDEVCRGQAIQAAIAYLKMLPGQNFSAALAKLRLDLEIRAERPNPEHETLTWEELQKLAASPWVLVGAHTVTHPILPNLSPEEISREIRESCDAIAAKLARPVRFFAYPNGDFNRSAQAVVREQGLVACSTGSGGFNPPGTELTELKRLGVEGLPPFRFALYLAGWEDVAARLRRSWARSCRVGKRFAHGVLLATGMFALRRFRQRHKLLVLRYEGVRAEGAPADLRNYRLDAEKFHRQMCWLRENYTPVSLGQVLGTLEGRVSLPAHPVLVTFDDAYQNEMRMALPILAKLGIPAALFVASGLIGTGRRRRSEELEVRLLASPNSAVKIPVPGGDFLKLQTPGDPREALSKLRTVLQGLGPKERQPAWKALEDQLPWSKNAEKLLEPRLSWDELTELVKQGVAIGAQPILDSLDPPLSGTDVARELRNAKRELESRLNTSVVAWCYPEALVDPDLGRLLEQEGFVGPFVAGSGSNDLSTECYLLRRVSFSATMSFPEFVAAVSGVARPGGREPLKILQISNYPPPECGWAMQTKLLTEELRRRGAICKILNINPENRRLKSREYVDVQNGLDYVWKLVKFALRGYRFHTHVNAESKKGYLLAIAAHLLGCAVGRPAIMTFHGGLPQTYFPRTNSRFLRLAYRVLFETAGRITCDNEQMKRAIQSNGTNGRPIAPFACFSPKYLDFKRRPLSPEVECFLAEHFPVFFCYVSFRPEYALDELRQGIQQFARRDPHVGFIWLGFPAKELPRAEAYLEKLDGGRPQNQNLLLLGNLDHDTFLSLLTRCFAYVRPPACDGISASVLEALALGVPVIAAENGRRPPGVVTYRFADAEDLCAKLGYVVDNYDAVKRATRLENGENTVDQAAEWVLRQDHAAVG